LELVGFELRAAGDLDGARGGSPEPARHGSRPVASPASPEVGRISLTSRGTGRASMRPKPDCLGPTVASAFQGPSVALAYQHRPPYPAETFAVLAELLGERERRLLDV